MLTLLLIALAVAALIALVAVRRRRA